MTRMTSPGLFVTFEGGDGVGKTTQAGLLESWSANAAPATSPSSTLTAAS